MLRMGRNSKDEQAGSEPTTNRQAQPAYPDVAPTPAVGPRQGAAVETPAASRATSDSESLARDIKEGVLNGFVGNGTVLTGDASFRGMLRVDGHLSGRIRSDDGTLIVSTSGQVDADITVEVAHINGTVNGDITAKKRIELGRVARVVGNIQTPALVIEQGAVFEGSCRMGGNGGAHQGTKKK